mmetsp:Transcript_65963/g.157524  ORF Transcript_65963/g.157524 Transcript_65963/m.157524 type:complete len:137 (+) Transcript_65963:89-499(+)
MHSTSSSSRDGPEPSIHAEGKEKQATRRGAVVKGCNGEVDSAMAEAIGEVLAESSPWLQDGKLLEPKGKSSAWRRRGQTPRAKGKPSVHPCERIMLFLFVFLVLLVLSAFLQLQFPGLYQEAGSSDEDCMDDTCDA